MNYPFDDFESLKSFISHPDIKKTKEPLRKCHVCDHSLLKASQVSDRRSKSTVVEHYNQCEMTEKIFDEMSMINEELLTNHQDYKEGQACSFCGKQNLKKDGYLRLHYLFCAKVEDIFEAYRNAQNLDSQQSLTENLAAYEPALAAQNSSSSSSSQSSSGSSQDYVATAENNSTDEDEEREILNSTRESFGETMSHLGSAKKKVVEKASREISDQMNVFYEARELYLPENSFNAHIAKHWHSVKKKEKIQILAACLPEEFLRGCADETVRKYISYFNKISKKYAKENHPQLMTRAHFTEALDLKEKQLYDLDNIEEPEGRRLRKIKDEDIHYILKYLFFSSDESPETDVYEAFTHRLRANTSENFFKVFLSITCAIFADESPIFFFTLKLPPENSL